MQLLHSSELPLSLFPPSYPHEHGTPTADLDHNNRSFLSTDQRTCLSVGGVIKQEQRACEENIHPSGRFWVDPWRTEPKAEASTSKQDDQIKL